MDEMSKLLSEENQELSLLLTQEKEHNNELTHLYETTVLDLKRAQEGSNSTNLELEAKVALLTSTMEETKLNFQKAIQAEQEAKAAFAVDVAQLNDRNSELQKALDASSAERNIQSNDYNKEIKILSYQLQELSGKLAATSEKVDSKKRKIREMKQREAQAAKEEEESFSFVPAMAAKVTREQNNIMNDVRNVPVMSLGGAANMGDDMSAIVSGSNNNNDDGDISDVLADILGDVGIKNNNNASDGNDNADKPKGNNGGINSPISSTKKLPSKREEFSIMSVMRRCMCFPLCTTTTFRR